jgi:RimJ/RimL family protein N-acetyltransferase
MGQSVTKDDLLRIRLTTARTVVRPMLSSDFPDILAWSDYPWPDTYRSMNHPSAMDSKAKYYWWQQIDDADRAVFVAACKDTGRIAALHAFVRIDWTKGFVDTMGVRVRPELCASGYGKETLQPLLHAVLDAGMRTIRLDVSAMNERAIRCYRACGMRITNEAWFPPDFDPERPEWASARQHLKRENDRWLERFYWMQIEAG